jgi:hypothetical protein
MIGLFALLLVALATAGKNDESASGMLARLEERRSLFSDESDIPAGFRVLASSTTTTEEAVDERTDPNDNSASTGTTSSSVSTSERIAARIARNAREELNRVNATAETFKTRHRTASGAKSHIPFQAVFTRLTGTGQANACTEQVFNNTPTSCVTLAVGPAILIGKFSDANVTTDVFDGDRDGRLDVLESLIQLSLVNGSNTLSSFDAVRKENVNRLSDFLLEVRNRADKNGGSIQLQSIVLTGRAGNVANPLPIQGESANFQTFGNGKTLISPCISVPLNDSFSLQIVTVIKGFRGLAHAQVDGAEFFEGGLKANGFKASGVTGSFNLLFGNNTDAGAPGLVGSPAFLQTGSVVGSVKFEKCAQFSYFN